MRVRLVVLVLGALTLCCNNDLEDIKPPCSGDACVTAADGGADGPGKDGPAADQQPPKPDIKGTDGPRPDVKAPPDGPGKEMAAKEAGPKEAGPKEAGPKEAGPKDQAIQDKPPLGDLLKWICNGSGVVDNPGEQCDGSDLAGQSCKSLGYDFGKLACNKPVCKFDTSGCHKHTWKRISEGVIASGSVPGDPCYPGSMPTNFKNENKINAKLSRAFWISTHEVTAGKFKALMGFDPSADKTCGADCPVDSVTWDEAAGYCNELSKTRGVEQCYKTGTPKLGMKTTDLHIGAKIYGCGGYRLPSEVEWEKAYRTTAAGALVYTSTYNGHLGYSYCTSYKPDPALSPIAQYYSNSGKKKWKVGQKKPNGAGLYDMSGNVYEWVQDWYVIDRQKVYGTKQVSDPCIGPNSYRSMRGGSFSSKPVSCRGSHRGFAYGHLRDKTHGFRCVKQWCPVRGFSAFATMNAWFKGSLIHKDTSGGGVNYPSNPSGKYSHAVPKGKDGGHHQKLSKPISSYGLLVQAKMAGPAGITSGRTSVGVMKDTTMAAPAGSMVKYGHGYTCNWDAAKAEVFVSRVDGALKETVLARAATGKTPDNFEHQVSCERKPNGSWELKVDGTVLKPTLNTKDLTHTSFTYWTVHLTADTTFRSLDDVYIRDCTR